MTTHNFRAYEIAINLLDPEKQLGKDYVMKTSGIALAMAEVLESLDLPAAYSVYETTLADLKLGGTGNRGAPGDTMSPRERGRAVGIAMKMVEVGQRLRGISEEETEGYLNWALVEIVKSAKGKGKPDSSDESPEKDLELPRFADGVELPFVLEQAAEYYSKKGKPE